MKVSLSEVAKRVSNAQNIFDLFGDDIDHDLLEYQKVCHPDLYIDDKIKTSLANETFKRITELAEIAKKPAVELKSLKRTYSLYNIVGVGDIADVYFARSENVYYLSKVPRIANTVSFLDAERSALSDIFTKFGKTHYSKYFPTYVESLLIKDKFQKKVNFFAYEPGYHTIEQVSAKYPSGLDAKHIAWIFKRLLTAIGVAHRSGWVYCAALPTHVMIDPNNHALKIIDWCHSVKLGQPAIVISSKYKDWYPPEVSSKKPLSEQTDIFLASKCIVYLSGGDIIM